jgi:hypothetical protein
MALGKQGKQGWPCVFKHFILAKLMISDQNICNTGMISIGKLQFSSQLATDASL